jgi:hypothetical protein
MPRLQLPDDDPIVTGLLNKQPARGRSDAVRMLIHLFVAHYGYTDVVNVVGAELVAGRNRDTDQLELDLPDIDVPVAVQVPVVDESDKAVHTETVEDNSNDIETDNTESQQQQQHDTETSAVDDMEAIFSAARNQN